jgi:periplasmic divalent cation tolerance protein
MNYFKLPQGEMKLVFYWQGKPDHSKEHSMLAKTMRYHLPAIQQLLSEKHSYDFPCLLALPILLGNRDFLNWIKEETHPQELIG